MASARRTMNHLRRKHSEPGTYPDSDGSTLYVSLLEDGQIYWERWFPDGRGLSATSKPDWDTNIYSPTTFKELYDPERASPKLKEKWQKNAKEVFEEGKHPRVLGLNPIPGMPNSVDIDEATNRKFESRDQLKAYYKKEGLIDKTINDIEREISAEKQAWDECLSARKQVVRFGNGLNTATFYPARPAGDPTGIDPTSYARNFKNG